MKKLFFTLVAMMIATLCFGQNTLVATLTHGDKITMYYGASALQQAHNAAYSGDVITLSGGTFTGFEITKAITIRGTGIDAATPTRIGDETSINISANDTCKFSVEGVLFSYYVWLYGSFSSPYFLKCQFNDQVNFYSRSSNYSSFIDNALFVNCKFRYSIHMNGSATATFSHCYIHEFGNDSGRTSKAQFINCVVGRQFASFYRSSFVNCILCGYSGDQRLPAETMAMNCAAYLWYDYYKEYRNSGIYANMPSSQKISCTLSTAEELFKTYRGSYSDSQTFELTDEAKTQFLGTDDTEIGMYGGAYPYNPTPSYPRITTLNVAKQTTADDKLSVEIEVSATE